MQLQVRCSNVAVAGKAPRAPSTYQIDVHAPTAPTLLKLVALKILLLRHPSGLLGAAEQVAWVAGSEFTTVTINFGTLLVLKNSHLGE